MVVAFYKVKNNPSATWLDKIIAFVTGGNYSHVELCAEKSGNCFSISPRENRGRWKKINLKSGKWDIIPVDIDYHTVKRESKKWENKQYDYLGALTAPLPIHWQNPNKIFCSEVSGIFLMLEKPWMNSPVKLAKLLKKKSYEKKEKK